MLLQPPNLLPLDSGYFPVSVHVSEEQNRIYLQLHFMSANSLIMININISPSPVHVEHGGKLQLVVDLLRSS